MTVPFVSDGRGGQSVKWTVVGDITYFAKAAAGSDEANPVWQCFKLDESSGGKITWADGNSLYNNIATDLTSLIYS